MQYEMSIKPTMYRPLVKEMKSERVISLFVNSPEFSVPTQADVRVKDEELGSGEDLRSTRLQ